MRASLLTLLVSLALSLVLAEAILRLFFPVGFREPPRPPARDVWMELLHRRSALPGLSYELAPGMEKRSHGTVVRTNSHDTAKLINSASTNPTSGDTTMATTVLVSPGQTIAP